jgi:hypothetical protein
VLRPKYDAVEHEAIKTTIHKNASPLDPEIISNESAHYTSFRVTNG